MLGVFLISVSRTIAVLGGYAAPMHLYGYLPVEPPPPQQQQGTGGAPPAGYPVDAALVCVAGEWYRYPSSFHLPSPWYRVAFLKSSFTGESLSGLTKPQVPIQGGPRGQRLEVPSCPTPLGRTTCPEGYSSFLRPPSSLLPCWKLPPHFCLVETPSSLLPYWKLPPHFCLRRALRSLYPAGMLPMPFPEGGWGTRAAPQGMNDRNQAAPGQYLQGTWLLTRSGVTSRGGSGGDGRPDPAAGSQEGMPPAATWSSSCRGRQGIPWPTWLPRGRCRARGTGGFGPPCRSWTRRGRLPLPAGSTSLATRRLGQCRPSTCSWSGSGARSE